MSGQSGTLAVTVPTLLVAPFQPRRRWIQQAVDRRFRAHHNAARTLEVLSGCLREQVDLEAVSDQVVEVVRDTSKAVHDSLWLRPPVPDR